MEQLAGVSKERIALIGSMTAQRAAAARLLGGTAPVAGSGSGPTGDTAAALLKAFRAAVYGFEIVVTQASAADRRSAAGTLSGLRTRSAELQRLAGSAAGPRPLGYALPFAVSTPTAAGKLATHVMTGLRDAVAGQLPAVAGDAAGLAGTVGSLADVCVQAASWRVPLTAFPGLSST